MPDVISYSAAISTCDKGTHPDQALEMLKEMQLQSVVPDLVKSNRTDATWNFLKWMQSSHSF